MIRLIALRCLAHHLREYLDINRAVEVEVNGLHFHRHLDESESRHAVRSRPSTRFDKALCFGWQKRESDIRRRKVPGLSTHDEPVKRYPRGMSRRRQDVESGR